MQLALIRACPDVLWRGKFAVQKIQTNRKIFVPLSQCRSAFLAERAFSFRTRKFGTENPA
jgi:hypothetical protein